MAELLLVAFVTVLIEKLASRSSQYLRDFIRSVGINEEEWNAKLQRIRDVLEDAEEQQLTNREVRCWLDDLHDLAYDIEDIVDELAIEAQAITSGNKSSEVMKPDDEMKTKIEDISHRLKGISERQMKLGLNSNVVGERVVLLTPLSTSLPPTHVIGRENEKKEIVDMLLNPAEIPVITILGMGGMGKTTLAQDVYNDKEVQGFFNLRAWVCVSDAFNVTDIIREILKQIPGVDNKEKLELNQLQEKLMNMLSRKRFLLVLDDIWNEDFVNWDILLHPFTSGEATARSRILATSRNESVASTMSLTGPRYHLTKLEDDDCLSLLASHALGRYNFDLPLHRHLKESGERIVKKCGHLPLAIKMVAGLLRRKPQLQCEWEGVINSREWTEEWSNILGRETVVTMSPQLPTMTFLPTSLPPTRVIGREKEKKEIVDMLLKPEADSAEVPVITILGRRGMGKTTLAQDVYNDKKVQGYFDLRAWVYVSDVFDVVGITRAILKEITSANNTENLELNQLQVKLKQMLLRKKFLLVLDDICNEDYEKWELLLRPLSSGAAVAESRILATTRNESVASNMSLTGPRYHLKELGEGSCLSLLASHALGRDDFYRHCHLKESGEKIVKKCGHLPLAIKMVADLLCRKPQLQWEWEAVINSREWTEEWSNILGPETVVTMSPQLPTMTFPTTSLPPSHVIGRKKEKKEIVDMLLKPEAHSAKVPVITILGRRGMGKTTLAKDIYHDENVVKCFDLKAWVWVSDAFDVAKITRAILKEITGANNTENLKLNQLQVKLKQMLSGKQFLLVLDDIWNEDHDKWELLLRPFSSGAAAAGSRILTTSRNESVASTMSLTGPRYHLKELGDDDCLYLLASHVLGRNDFDLHPDLKESGKKIVKKCGHLPLAIKMVAGLLRRKPQSQCEWEAVINSREWTEEWSNILGREMVVTMSPQLPTMNFLPMTSLPPSHVIGREKEKWEIVGMLFKAEADSAEVPVITILGMGGIGKTTLAQDIYHDEDVVKFFDLKAWVCVSDVFDVTNITRAILEEIPGPGYTEMLKLNQLQEKLKEMLSGKKFLLVLDDIWNEDYEKWELLLRPFPSGAAAAGSRILATTRNEYVASTMSLTRSWYYLRVLGDGDCLSLLASHALGRDNFDLHPDLKESGKKIVEKCGRLPLAIKMVAGLLRNKPQLQCEWEAVIDSNNWAKTFDHILPALRVSYYHLPSHLKRCFAYCSIIPKDYSFDRNELISLWMAEGFLEQPTGGSSRRMEDFGHDCFQELLSRSFFQITGENESEFIMHDLINDLAVHVAGEKCFRIDDDEEYKISEKTRHLSFPYRKHEVTMKSDVFNIAHRSRTFLPLPPKSFSTLSAWYSKLDAHFADIFSELRSLRVLDLRCYRIVQLPNKIEGLKHLRYIDLSSTKIDQLQEFVCFFYNLQTLLLNNCSELRMLPTKIGCLTNLRHLGLEHTPKLEKMPSGIGKLKRLQSLSKIIVWSNLKDLKDLRHLRGTLSIKELNNVTNDQDAADADLSSKEHLEVLKLQWQYYMVSVCSARNRLLEKRALEKLQPHRNLKELYIEGYGGIEFPSWVGGQSMLNVVKIHLQGCSKITHLPPLGKLPLLKDLVIESLDSITSVGAEFYDCSAEEIAFPSLKTLRFNSIKEWKEWSPPVAGKGVFPHLRELKIENCSKLKKLPKGFHGLESLEEMRIIFCQSLVWDATDKLPKSLIKLELKDCPKSVLSNWGFQSLTSLQTLEMWGFEDDFSTSTMFPHSLTGLFIFSFPNLKSLSNSLQNLTSLRTLSIRFCPKLESLAGADDDQASLQIISSLDHLHIYGCSNVLREKCKKEGGKYWPNIQNISNREIK